MSFVLRAGDRDLLQAQPLIWNSDQGNHFTIPLYVERPLAAGIQISMNDKGQVRDNNFTIIAKAHDQVRRSVFE